MISPRHVLCAVKMKRWDKIINTDEEVRLSKYLLKVLLPYLRQLDGEQMIEKEREAKRLRISLSELKVKVADYPKYKSVYRDMNLGVQIQLSEFIFRGRNYPHGGKEETIKKIEPRSAAQPEIREWSRSGWHACRDGSIPCPKSINDCDHGFLEPRSILGPNCISELVCKAKELEETLNFVDAEQTLDSRCSCLKPVRNADGIHNNTRKASSHEDSSDNFLYCPRAVDLHKEDFRHFQWHWSKGEPVIVSNVHLV
ncbi:unnamed protein product [Trifolium pratense]|uniref:Uncharacterized protein n=1 Tax=Trifolium pratense TaxID=57577 RepID=A0ACB0KZ10_TRIPR|nr:unnamed protein product [Trifolium pratense]